MVHDLQNIMQKIVVVQETIIAPSGVKAITKFYDEHPASVGTYPAFVNVEESIEEQSVWATGGRKINYIVNMHLVFAAGADIKYNDRAMRAWVRPVLDAFGKKTTLDGATGVAAKSLIRSADFGLVTIGGAEYWAATFQLVVIVEEAFAWAV